MRVLDLFSGMGNASLGLEWAGGFDTVAFCEIDATCHYWLKKHWPNTPIFDDIKTLTGDRVRNEVGDIDLVIGGFPCQDISVAGRGNGIGTKEAPTQRSGLVYRTIELVGQLRPRWIVFENVPALRNRGADTVLTDLDEQGYACWPLVVGAHHIGASHKRDRVWIIGLERAVENARRTELEERRRRSAEEGAGSYGEPAGSGALGERRYMANEIGSTVLADRASLGMEGLRSIRLEEPASMESSALLDRSGDRGRVEGWVARPGEEQYGWEASRLTAVKRRVGRQSDGTPSRVDKLKALGNSMQPQNVEAIGIAINNVERLVHA
jgi:DNA (cytosine-5)-methyltransferase 1